MSDEHVSLSEFHGRARLFPLPNLVLFPHVIQPLHIFEPRYRQMTADALDGDRLIALALLRPGWEAAYHGNPRIYPVACLGKIIAEQRLKDGRYNLLVRGVVRLHIDEEVATPHPYRSARVRILLDQGVVGPKTGQRLRALVTELLPTWFASQAPLVKQFRKLLKGDLPLGSLCDVLSFALPLDVAFKQRLLQELNVERRIRRLLHHLKTHGASLAPAEEPRLFPPAFSEN